MVGKPRSSIECGKIRVDFHVRKDLERVSTVSMNTPRGPVKVSSPEATALELVGYSKHAGGIVNVATVLVDLAEVLDVGRLIKEATNSPLAWSQRLGFLLEWGEASEIAEALSPFVEQRVTRVTPLDASLPRTAHKRSPRWRVAINTDVEVDEAVSGDSPDGQTGSGLQAFGRYIVLEGDGLYLRRGEPDQRRNRPRGGDLPEARTPLRPRHRRMSQPERAFPEGARRSIEGLWRLRLAGAKIERRRWGAIARPGGRLRTPTIRPGVPR